MVEMDEPAQVRDEKGATGEYTTPVAQRQTF